MKVHTTSATTEGEALQTWDLSRRKNEGLPSTSTASIGTQSKFVEGWRRKTNHPYVLSIIKLGTDFVHPSYVPLPGRCGPWGTWSKQRTC